MTEKPAPAVWLVGCAENTQWFCVLVAVADTVSGCTPMAVAVIVCVPAVGPSVHVVVARPEAFVAAVAGVTEPPPLATAKVILAPVTALPVPSVRATVMGESCAPAVAL